MYYDSGKSKTGKFRNLKNLEILEKLESHGPRVNTNLSYYHIGVTLEKKKKFVKKEGIIDNRKDSSLTFPF